MASEAGLKFARLKRSVIALSGDAQEQQDFLQDLLTNDVSVATPDRLIYAALLTPQGKFLADMLVRREGDGIRLDVASELAETLVKRLTMYRLRRPVDLEITDEAVFAVWDDGAPEGVVDGALRDPRHSALGWRAYGSAPEAVEADYEAHRLSLGVPDAPHDLIPNETFVLEAGFEALSGVDFQKGCYVGQEIVARMKHKTELRKGIVAVQLDGAAEAGTALLTPDGKEAGTLLSNAGGIGLAQLRFDRAKAGMTSADGVTVTAKGRD